MNRPGRQSVQSVERRKMITRALATSSLPNPGLLSVTISAPESNYGTKSRAN